MSIDGVEKFRETKSKLKNKYAEELQFILFLNFWYHAGEKLLKFVPPKDKQTKKKNVWEFGWLPKQHPIWLAEHGHVDLKRMQKHFR